MTNSSVHPKKKEIFFYVVFPFCTALALVFTVSFSSILGSCTTLVVRPASLAELPRHYSTAFAFVDVVVAVVGVLPNTAKITISTFFFRFFFWKNDYFSLVLLFFTHFVKGEIQVLFEGIFFFSYERRIQTHLCSFFVELVPKRPERKGKTDVLFFMCLLVGLSL